MRTSFESSNVYYTLRAVCAAQNVNKEEIVEMVSWGIADPVGFNPDRWLFSQNDFNRIGSAIRFHEELGINIPGAALAIDLLDELEKIRMRSKIQ